VALYDPSSPYNQREPWSSFIQTMPYVDRSQAILRTQTLREKYALQTGAKGMADIIRPVIVGKLSKHDGNTNTLIPVTYPDHYKVDLEELGRTVGNIFDTAYMAIYGMEPLANDLHRRAIINLVLHNEATAEVGMHQELVAHLKNI